MADEEKTKEKSTEKILQALDALSQLQQARANNRRATSLASPRSGSSKDGDVDARATADAAAGEAAPPRPRVRHRSSLTSSPSLSKPNPKLEKTIENGEDEEEGDDDDGALVVIIKIQGLSPDEPRPRRRRLSVMLPFRSGSKLDLKLLGKEFTDKKCAQGERVRQWDMVFPLARNGKGGVGELVVKLPLFHSIDDGTAREYKTISKIRSSDGHKKLTDKARRKLRRYYINNMLTPNKMTQTKTPKMGVPAQDLRGIDSFKLDKPDAKAELNPIDEEVKEAQQKEKEREPADEPTPVAEVMTEELQQEEPQSEPADEPAPVAEVEEELQHEELQSEPADESTPMAEVMEELKQNEPQSEPADEPSSPVAEVEEEEQQNEPELEAADQPTPIADAEEEDQKKEPEREPEDEQEDDESELPELDVVNKDVEEQEVKAEMKDEAAAAAAAEAENGSAEVAGDEVEVANKAEANGLEEKSVEATIVPSNLSNGVVVDAVKPMNGEVARPEEFLVAVIPEQGEDKGAAVKPPRPRFKWRTVGLLVPMAVFVSNALGGKR